MHIQYIEFHTMIPVFPPKYEEIWQTYLSSQPVNGKSQLYTPQKSNIDTKLPYFKGVHLFQTIFLGIQPLAFGLSGMYMKGSEVKNHPNLTRYARRNSHITYHKSQDLPFPHPHRTPFLVQRFTSRLACSRVPRGSMTPKATNIFAEIKALRMEFEFCYMGVEHVRHHNSFWKSFRPFWLWDGDTHDSAVSSLCIYIYTCVFIPGRIGLHVYLPTFG